MKWGIQKFLNDVDSDDDGWFKFSIRPYNKSGSGKAFGYNVYCTIADCSSRITLDFQPEHCYTDEDSHKVLKDIKVRRKKIKLFRDSVNAFADKVLEMLDKYEAEVKQSPTE